MCNCGILKYTLLTIFRKIQYFTENHFENTWIYSCKFHKELAPCGYWVFVDSVFFVFFFSLKSSIYNSEISALIQIALWCYVSGRNGQLIAMKWHHTSERQPYGSGLGIFYFLKTCILKTVCQLIT